jgi:hypothetical protein
LLTIYHFKAPAAKRKTKETNPKRQFALNCAGYHLGDSDMRNGPKCAHTAEFAVLLSTVVDIFVYRREHIS